MQHLRAATQDILKRIEILSGKSVQLMRDDSLSVLATLQMARQGAAFHVLRYQPTDEPLDYLVAFQAGFVLRLFENAPDRRFDFAPAQDASRQVEPLLAAGLALGEDDKKVLPEYAKTIAQWALMTLRSLPIGMRIDQWIATEYPELKALQASSIALQQQQNMAILSHKLGKLTVPTTLMGPIAAYAMFADRLAGSRGFAIPFEAAGLRAQGLELLEIWDTLPIDAGHDCELVDRWASACCMNGWYDWIPYQP